jgi:hypothetical protein
MIDFRRRIDAFRATPTEIRIQEAAIVSKTALE